MVNRKRIIPKLMVLTWLCITLALLSGQPNLSSSAQGSAQWAPPKPIPLYYDVFPPIMVADRNQTVHAFNSQSIEMGVFAIYYRTWRAGLGWSPPNDILLPEPSGSAQDVLLDDEGKLHLIFYKGEEEIGTILYTTAWATQASIAQAWSTPVEIATSAGPLDNAVLAGDGKGKMYVVFVGQKEGIGIYEVHSEDGGQSWSQAQALQVVRERTRFPTHIDLVLDSHANLHAVWAVLDDNGLGTKVFYAQREFESENWSSPFLLAAREGNDYAADWPAIIEYNSELIVTYMDGTVPTGVPPTQWMRRSFDGGNTWTAPVRPFPHVGEYGASQMVIDSAGTLHIVLAARVGRPEVGGMWHGIWIGDGWGELELFTPRSAAAARLLGSYSDAGAASIPHAVISQGNVLLASWWHNMQGAPPAGYSFLYLDAPQLPLQTLPGPAFTALPTSTPTREVTRAPSTSAVTATPTAQLSDESSGSSFANPGVALLFGALPVLLIIGLVFLIRRLSTR